MLAGDNGQGKTNFLEAVYLLGTLRPLRAVRLEELPRFGQPSARARARVEARGLERIYEVEVTREPPRKIARVDGKAVRATADYFGGFNVVVFVPDDLRLPRGAPGARRRFLDRAVWNAQPSFLDPAQTYEKSLRSRNALLRGGAPPGQLQDLLDVYDEQLAAAGARIVAMRRAYVEAIAPRVQAAWERITESGLPVTLSYATADELAGGVRDGGPAEVADLRARLAGLYAQRRRRDQLAGYTTAGPHADDLELSLDGRPARLYASQGQLRALTLALKVAEIQHLEAVLGDAPVLLLDDVSSELDARKSAFLFRFLGEMRCQVFITTTDAAHVGVARGDEARRDFRVRAGTIEPASAAP